MSIIPNNNSNNLLPIPVRLDQEKDLYVKTTNSTGDLVLVKLSHVLKNAQKNDEILDVSKYSFAKFNKSTGVVQATQDILDEIQEKGGFTLQKIDKNGNIVERKLTKDQVSFALMSESESRMYMSIFQSAIGKMLKEKKEAGGKERTTIKDHKVTHRNVTLERVAEENTAPNRINRTFAKINGHAAKEKIIERVFVLQKDRDIQRTEREKDERAKEKEEMRDLIDDGKARRKEEALAFDRKKRVADVETGKWPKDEQPETFQKKQKDAWRAQLKKPKIV